MHDLYISSSRLENVHLLITLIYDKASRIFKKLNFDYFNRVGMTVRLNNENCNENPVEVPIVV